MGWDATAFVQSQRSRYRDGIFALNFGGTTHNVIYTPGLATALLNQKSSYADFEHVGSQMMWNVFGFPVKEKDKWFAAMKDVQAGYKYLLTEPHLGQMVQQTVQRMRKRVVEFVTFTASPVDQMLWERTAVVEVKKDGKGEEVVEASLLPLVRDFCAQVANPTIMGSNFLANFPGIFEEVWTFDRGFLFLGAGLPRWFPILRLTRAHIARKKLLEAVYAFHNALEKEIVGQDPGPDWRDLDDVSPLVRARTEAYRKHGFSIQARAACEVALVWAANANSNSLVFWMINRIYSDPSLLAKLREEIAPYVDAVQPKQEFPVPEPPRLEAFDVDGLCNNCPLLKSCYVESLRVDTASWSLKLVQQDFVLQSREKESQGWLLKKGQYAHAAHDLHNTDPNYFQDPDSWKADRHIKLDGEEKKANVDLGSIRPYGMSASPPTAKCWLTASQVEAQVCAKVALSHSKNAWLSRPQSSRSGISNLLVAASGRYRDTARPLAYMPPTMILVYGSSGDSYHSRAEVPCFKKIRSYNIHIRLPISG
jgi:cytochrome P450